MASTAAPHSAAPAAASRRALAGWLALALWLGWVVPPLLVGPVPAGPAWTAEQILARVSLPLTGLSAPVLVLSDTACACMPPVALPELQVVDRRTDGRALPYAWVVLDASHRLIYAGPAQLDPGCGTATPSAAALVQHLIAHPQAPLIVPSRCSCPQE